MLTALRIRNLALVTDLTLELQPGYNVITGETGAGKSILIGALGLILGERADRNLIRSGADSCSVEAVFDAPRLQSQLAAVLEEHGLDSPTDGQVIIKRTITSGGATRQFINGSPTTLAVLGAVGEWLVDIHGPHEHQSLLQPMRQLAILDAFGGLEADREKYSALLRRRVEIQAAKAELIVDEKAYAQQLDLLRFQTNEISAANLQPDEELGAESAYRRASNSQRLTELSELAHDLLSESETSLVTRAGQLGRALQELQRLDPGAASLVSCHEQLVSTMRELQTELSGYADKAEPDPARLRELEERVNLIQSLKRKYGATVAEVVAFGENARRKLESLEQRDVELVRLNAELTEVDSALADDGRNLSSRRRKVIPKLNQATARQLNDLGFKQSLFEAALTTANPPDFKSTGLDTIEFQFAPNPGEPPRPLRAIASSGELARVMLALKTVLAGQDQVPVLVFDEVDANVGGETAHAVGEKMRQLARGRQVLCITHLPQVAAPALAHYLAEKQTRAGRTVSEITLLTRPDRVTELARMLGGQNDATRRHAESLLE